MELFKAENIHKNFVDHVALNNVSIHVPEGSIFGLLGPNGAGKTTLIRIINQIFAPDSGELFFKNGLLRPEHVAQIGYLPEERGLYKKMKVGEQALYLARLKGLSKQDALKRLKYWFEKFEIQAWWDKKVEELSKGMQQKVQFIVTVLHKPPLLIFDEPFSGFDPINANLLKNEILQLKKEGATIIFSTHNMGSVEELCDNISLINKAEVILEGHIDTIREQHKSNTFEVKFLGLFNKLEATLSSEYEIVEATHQDDIHSVRFRLIKQMTTNELLTILMKKGTIVGFNEVIPTMNDIFIKVVEGSNKGNDLL
ncbi:MAG: ATP-binding cassette domain-containing protein [Bacteroidales bacterium]|nr:ATP-binding cassette domain-containing protein [Bacteroidales bacterium]MCF8454651.1 ATP-binding cassette domain-containing protein [Bacteroidales bacterium]